ncbi:MAG TPA: recombinase family protein [Oscillospiraceae bacterium]|nr:recombinase family protein [Oscillospiraceae bacterium]
MIYGYARVSTKGQARNGNSLEAQQDNLKANGAVKVFVDSFTGTKISRPEFDKLLQTLKSGDTLIVTKLDRIARSLTQGSALVTELINKDIKVNILNIGIMDNTPSSKLIRNIFFSFAEFERDMIVERTQEGKAVAKETKPNYKEGRHKTEVENFENYEKRVQAKELTVQQAVKELGISRRTWYNLKTA